MSPRCRSVFVLACMLTLAACSDDAGPTDAASRPLASVMAPLADAGPDAIPGRYIVVLRPTETNAAGVASQLVGAHGGTVHHTYEHALQGFAATLPQQAVDAIRRNPNVVLVEPDAVMHPSTTQPNPPSWGLDRIDARSGLNNSYSYTPDGSGVTVYIIDSGIRITHTDFGGRASVGIDLVDPADGMNGQDCNGHGTHVAGTVAGTLHGVAKGAEVVSVRVFPCSGGAPTSRIIAAVDWVTGNAELPAVANMSLGGGFSSASNSAVMNSIASGIVYAVAAGNDNQDACFASPASTPAALTVGSSTSADTRSSFSNWGTCLDLFAPGSSITSAWATGDAATLTISGTSMASPHVAGVAALYLDDNPLASPATVSDAIKAAATLNRLTTLGFAAPPLGAGSPNALLFSPLTPYGRVTSLNPSSLLFTFVRTSGGGASMMAGDARPLFEATGTGELHAAASAVDDGTVHITSTSDAATAYVSLLNVGTSPLEYTATPDVPWLVASPPDGLVPAGATTILTTTVNSTELSDGTFGGTVTIGTEDDPDTGESIAVTTRVAPATALTLGDAALGLSASAGQLLFFEVSVPPVPELIIAISGGTGDADLYVRYGDVPAFHAFDCRPFAVGNVETCRALFPVPGTYYVMLHAWSSFSGVNLHTHAGGPPQAPSGIAADPFSSSRVDVAWNDDSNNETGFALQRTIIVGGSPTGWDLLNGGPLAPNSTSFSDETVVAGTTYRYRVRSCNTNGCSSWSRSSNVTPPSILDPPTAPNGFTVVPVSTSSIDLSWNVTDVTTEAVHMERRVKVGSSYSPWAEIGEVAGHLDDFTDTALDEGTQYQYRIRACNSGGCSSYVAAPAVKTLSTVPLAPSDAMTIAASGSTLRTTWVDNSGNETRFYMHRRTRNPDNSFGAWAEIARPAANSTQFNDNGLTGGDTHQYRVRACNAAGCSAFSVATAVTVPTVPAAPSGISEAIVSSSAIDVSWTDNSADEDQFQVHRRMKGLDNVFSAWVEIATPAANTTIHSDTGLEAGRTYQYRVRSCNPAGCSTFIVSAQVTTPN